MNGVTNMNNKKYFLLIIMILILTLCSCDFDESNKNLSGGILLDDEMLSEIQNEILSGETFNDDTYEKDDSESSVQSEDNADEEDESNERNENADVVYWTKSGYTWHISINCSYLKKSDNILSGSVEDAVEAGKTKVCSRCNK